MPMYQKTPCAMCCSSRISSSASFPLTSQLPAFRATPLHDPPQSDERESSSPSLKLPLPNPLPKPPQPPHPPHSAPLLSSPPFLHHLPPPPLPHTPDPPSQPILDALPLHRPRVRHQSGRDPPMNVLARQHCPCDERLGRRSHGQPPREPDRRQAAGELARDDGRRCQEDAARDQVGEGGPLRRGQERGEGGAREAEACAVEDGGER